jgi:D-alanine-D-alanine ligase
VYDYAARYTAGATEFVVPAEVSDSVATACAEVAVTVHSALGLRDLSRSDLIVDADGQVWFLEVNVAPGVTETSLVPLAVEAGGLDLGEVMSGLVERACRRGPHSASSASR